MQKKTRTGDDLRSRAEEALKSGENSSIEYSGENMRQLIHELRVHQIELEMQNEELRSAQARLEESRMRYADLYDFAPVGYFTFDEQGRIIEVNLTGAKQLGIERSHLINMPFLVLVIESDRKEYLSHLKKVFDTREGDTREVRLKVKGGGEFYARLDSLFMKNVDNTVFCRTSVTDISEKKRAEEVLRKAHDELEAKVRERTAELTLTNRALEENAAKLKRLNKELQDFTWIASHDLQEPLRKIQAFGDRLRHHCGVSLNEEGQDHLERMINSANRMQNLILALLAYSRLTDRPATFELLDLRNTVQQVVADLENRFEETGGTAEIGELPEIEADPTQMQQLFQNLIANALKYRREVPPVIRIYGSLLPEGLCRISVEDNGIGFEEQHIDRIFRPFQRLHHKKSQYEGTGIGLAICRKVVEYHGGTITARSTPGRGTTFIISLPLKQGEGAE